MLFINNTGKTVVVRIKRDNLYDWINVNEGEKIDLSESYGLNLGFEVFKGENEKKEDNADVEEISEQEKKKEYKEELKEIKGVGDRTAEDIIKIFPTKEKLIEAVRANKKIPVRDDIEKKIKKRYG